MFKCCKCDEEFENHDLEERLQETATCDEDCQAYCPKCEIHPQWDDVVEDDED